MPYRITQTTGGQHVGKVLDTVQVGNVITFEDGDVIPIDEVFSSPDGETLIVTSPNHQMTLRKEP